MILESAGVGNKVTVLVTLSLLGVLIGRSGSNSRADIILGVGVCSLLLCLQLFLITVPVLVHYALDSEWVYRCMYVCRCVLEA